MLKDTFGTVKKYDATSVEKPMCDTEKPGRYREHNGTYLAAQIPRTILVFHGREGEGATLRIVSPISRITSSGLLSSYNRQRVEGELKLCSTYLNIQQYPNVFQSGLCEILEQVGEAGHGLMRFFQRSQLAQKLVVAVDELLIPPKATLQVPVLASLST